MFSQSEIWSVLLAFMCRIANAVHLLTRDFQRGLEPNA